MYKFHNNYSSVEKVKCSIGFHFFLRNTFLKFPCFLLELDLVFVRLVQRYLRTCLSLPGDLLQLLFLYPHNFFSWFHPSFCCSISFSNFLKESETADTFLRHCMSEHMIILPPNYIIF